MGIIAVNDLTNKSSGALVYWSLRGSIDRENLVESLKNCSVHTIRGIEFRPNKNSMSTVALRAVRAAISKPNCWMPSGYKYLVRKIGTRGCWDVVAEALDNTDDELKYFTVLRVQVSNSDIGPTVDIQIKHRESVDVTPWVRSFASSISTYISQLRDQLTTQDISGWLLGILSNHVLGAVSMRARGGFYFLPEHALATWDALIACLRDAEQPIENNWRFFKVPALESADAVEAVLEGLNNELSAGFTAMEEYLLSEKVSTRGLNAYGRDLEILQRKAQRYAELLGVQLPDLENRAEQLKGAIVAARLKRSADSDS